MDERDKEPQRPVKRMQGEHNRISSGDKVRSGLQSQNTSGRENGMDPISLEQALQEVMKDHHNVLAALAK